MGIQPPDVGEVYIDGAYVGTAGRAWDDLDIDPGVHSIEIRADGYETLQDSLLVVAGRAMSYTRTLKRATRLDSERASTVAPQGPSTYYVIRGCYAGNVPPEDAGLPPTCDVKRAIVVTR